MDPDRVRGTLLGLAVGDALGTTHEFRALEAPAFPGLATGPLDDVVGGGPFGLAPGQVTDDTQMATCLAASLLGRRRFDAEDVAARYAAWVGHAFDVGAQTARALRLVAGGTPALAAGRRIWEASERRPAGNGSLMRTAPLAAFLGAEPQALRRAALDESAITHWDPRCRLACAAFDAAIAHALGAPGASPRSMHEAAGEELGAAAMLLCREEPDHAGAVREAAAALASDLAAARDDDPALHGPELHLYEQQGFVRVAFRLSFWELHHAPSLPAALVDVANRGGDADTNAAIAGALLGALHGAAALPAPWTERVLGALGGQDGPLATTYHPKVLVALADACGARSGG